MTPDRIVYAHAKCVYQVYSLASQLYILFSGGSRRGRGERKIRLVTLDRFSCAVPESWHYQSDCRGHIYDMSKLEGVETTAWHCVHVVSRSHTLIRNAISLTARCVLSTVLTKCIHCTCIIVHYYVSCQAMNISLEEGFISACFSCSYH